MSSSKLRPEQQTDEIRPWLPPEMEGECKPERPADEVEMEDAELPAPPTAEELEAVRQQAYEEGFEKGKEDGFEFGHKEALQQEREQIKQHIARLERQLSLLDEPLRELDRAVEEELVTLVIAMVRQLVRREVRADPNQIVGVVREALAILPVSSRNVRLLLHPEDAELIREIYALGEADLGWDIIEDPVINRGGCRVITDTSQVDATLESRLANLIAPLLAGSRSLDESER
ncbi:flagellar assembly protein FliH [endosymbiont of Ridgeia piscesae]|jgi:flagellar assembly protein FliH|uniref:Flagellar assembly protein FliH n=1 Tax=endosymbiont of Ridgeia piscesae TaxID=54398 RepID=A0A0T5Z573_9GAMM|nr:flagellar assembly protein FliH [endosymbiont of Ridgeia piscesae]KRT55469.1 Flagellar biosynthesis/type III secretory pathway protein FliH [endosymbiont of Ridgeia piscesae]KRT58039.1 flagellar assembly protein FliH [endosymbiont of Ridgeia piscesae]